MLKLLRLMRDYKKETVLAPAFKLLEALFELFVPLVIANIIDYGIPLSDKGYTVKMSVVLVLLGFVGFAASVIAQYFSAAASVGFASKVRRALFGKIQQMSYSELDRAGTASLITNMTSDINQLQSGVNLTLRLFLRSPCIVFGAMIMAFTINARLALIFTAMIAVLSVIVFAIILGTVPLYKKVQASLSSVTRRVRENLGGVRILRGFCLENSEVEKFGEDADKLHKAQNYVGKFSALMNPLTYVVVNVAIIALIGRGAIRVNSGSLSQGELVAMYNYMTQILVELVKLANLIITMTKAVACGQRISSVIEGVEGERTDGETPVGKNGTPKVEFKNVSFRYAGAGDDSLKNVSFIVNAGETVGIIGATGSGKSTLVSLIPAFYLSTDGEVLIDGVDVKNVDVTELRRKCGIVPQYSTLMRGTLRDNLNWRSEDVSDTDIMLAAATAQATDVIMRKEGGLDALSEQHGRNFSGGQRQRLAITRALVGAPEILIFDDSSSALDYATDAALRDALAELPHKHTTFIVSQRTSSIMHADKILVIEDGMLIGEGTHSELYDNCAAYREIHDLQFKSENGGENNG